MRARKTPHTALRLAAVAALSGAFALSPSAATASCQTLLEDHVDWMSGGSGRQLSLAASEIHVSLLPSGPSHVRFVEAEELLPVLLTHGETVLRTTAQAVRNDRRWTPPGMSEQLFIPPDHPFDAQQAESVVIFMRPGTSTLHMDGSSVPLECGSGGAITAQRSVTRTDPNWPYDIEYARVHYRIKISRTGS